MTRSWSRLLLLLLPVVHGCRHTNIPRPDPVFAPYITAFTAGPVSCSAPVLVRLAEGLDYTDTSAANLATLFDLDPAAEGSVRWHDDHTLAFVPKAPLEPGTIHVVDFHLGRLVKVPNNTSTFRFGFRTLEQHLAVELADVAAMDPGESTVQSISWRVNTADHAGPDALLSCFRAELDGRVLRLRLTSTPDGLRHDLVADSVVRGPRATMLELAWDGGAVGSTDKGRTELALPEAGRFTLLGARTAYEGDHQVRLLFSEAPDPDQELAGLAGITGAPPASIALDGNALVVQPADPQVGDVDVFVAGGLRSRAGSPLARDTTVRMRFPEPGPAVRFVGEGVVLPTTGGRKVPFEAVNLRAVAVRIIRIHADNIPQFLQANDLAGENELARVGRVVAEEDVPLTGTDGTAPGRWNRYFLDLDRMIAADPGAIHRVEIGFRQDQAAFACTGDAPPAPEQWMSGHTEVPKPDESAFDQAGYYYVGDDSWYDEDYDHSRRDDPCSSSYYGARRKVKRNILSSDLGLLAKRNASGGLHVVVSDIRTGAAVGGAQLDVLDLQLRSVGTLTTDAQGIAELKDPAHVPFLVVARSLDQRGYLRVDDGSALDVSAFDVGGSALPKGLKGHLFGERGVWRPGDSLHLAFILHDRERALPKDHPVVLELIDPRGRITHRSVRRQATGDQYGFPCATSADSPTGTWTARVTVGDATFQRPLRIETVKPNRMRIALDLGEGPVLAAQLPRPTHLQATWQHGAPAAQAPVVVSVGLSRAEFKPTGAAGFLFDDLGHQLTEGETVVFEGRTDDAGHARFPFDLRTAPGAPAALRLNVVSRVSDPGGDASTDRQETVLHPYRSYAGVRPPPPDGPWENHTAGTMHHFDVISIDASGRPLPAHTLQVQVLKVDEERWWEGAMDGPTSGRIGESLRVLSTRMVTTDERGRGIVDLNVDPSAWGRHLVRVEDPASGHVSVAMIHFTPASAAAAADRPRDPAATRLAVTVAKEVHTPGEDVMLTIPSTAKGSAIVSLESGHRVLSITRIPLTPGGTIHRFKATAAMMPNIHAHVTLLQPHGDVANDLPIRLYGVVPVRVEDPATHLAPVIDAPREIKPGRPFTIAVSERSGRAMNYTLYAVDEGLLDLTRFRTPDPWAQIYAREALGVQSFDLYDKVIGAFGVQAERVLAVGGSDGGGPVDPSRIGRFKPVVLHAGPLALGPGQRAEHTFTIENYVGSVRVMVVASHVDGAYGHAEHAVPVRQPLMVLATLPRVLGPGEEVDLPVTVFAMEKGMRDVAVSVSVDGNLEAAGPRTGQLRFNSTGEKVVRFKLRTKEHTGAARVMVSAQGGSERASTRIDLGVRASTLPLTRADDGSVQAGGKAELSITPLGVAGTNALMIEVSDLPPLGLERRLRELLGYPHGCLEQTVSKAFPQLYLDGLVDLSDAMKAQIRSDVGTAVGKLSALQRGDGHFNYWPGAVVHDDWSSIYAGHFLLEAGRLGHTIPATMRSKWTDAQRRAARAWSPKADHRSSFIQAYRLYALALAGASEPAAMNRLRSMAGLEPMARWTLAAAYAELGRSDAAAAVTQGLPYAIADYNELGDTYGSGIRDEALIALGLVRAGRQADAAPVVRRISERLGSDAWISTQGTSFALMAVARFSASNGSGNGLDLAVAIDGRPVAVRIGRPLWRQVIDAPDAPHTVQVANNGKGMVFTRITRTGTPRQGEEPASSNGLAMSVSYTTLDGRSLDPARLTQGTDLLVRIELAATGADAILRNVALTQLFPSGWEVRNTRMEGMEGAYADSPFTHQDIRDDRVMTYFDLVRGQRAVFHQRVTAAYAGRFHLPGVQVEAMYDAHIHARSKGMPVQVLAPGADAQAAR